jgi:hypothetical protein
MGMVAPDEVIGRRAYRIALAPDATLIQIAYRAGWREVDA